MDPQSPTQPSPPNIPTVESQQEEEIPRSNNFFSRKIWVSLIIFLLLSAIAVIGAYYVFPTKLWTGKGNSQDTPTKRPPSASSNSSTTIISIAPTSTSDAVSLDIQPLSPDLAWTLLSTSEAGLLDTVMLDNGKKFYTFSGKLWKGVAKGNDPENAYYAKQLLDYKWINPNGSYRSETSINGVDIQDAGAASGVCGGAYQFIAEKGDMIRILGVDREHEPCYGDGVTIPPTLPPSVNTYQIFLSDPVSFDTVIKDATTSSPFGPQ